MIGSRRASPAAAPLSRRRNPPSMHAARARSRFDQVADAGGRGPLVEAGLFDRRADEQRAVVPRHQIAALAPDHAAEGRAGPGEMQQLAAHRPYRQPRLDAFDVNLTRPAARREHDAVPCQRTAIGLDAKVGPPRARCGARARARSAARRAGARRRERAGQIAGRDVAVRRNQEAADDRFRRGAALRARAPAPSSSRAATPRRCEHARRCDSRRRIASSSVATSSVPVRR